LSPYLFAVYIDGLVDKIRNCPFGCFIKNVCMSILLYADDFLLIAISVTALQKLLHICDHELSSTDMLINVKKSSCLRIGQAYKCSKISTLDGHDNNWFDSIRYPDIHVFQKNWYIKLISITVSSQRIFQNLLLANSVKKFEINVLLKIPPHPTRVAAVPCEIYIFLNCTNRSTAMAS